MAHKLTTCTFCGAGCGLYLETAGNQVIGAYPSMSHPANEGKICVRGWHAHEVVSSPDRLTRPLVREKGQLREAEWDEAFQYIVARLQRIRADHGPDALAFLNSPRCSNEESYLLQKFARAVVGTNNVDHGAGVYSNNSIAVLLRMTGVPASTNSLSEIDSSEVIIVDGVDLGRQMPTVGGRVLRAKLDGATLIVIDSRRHRLADNADLFLQLKPATEVFLYGAMAKVIVDRGLMDLPFIRARCDDWESYLASVAEFDLLESADRCGVAPELIEAASLAYARAARAAILYSTGIEARDPASVECLVDLALLTGHFGREGAGVFALTEQNNLQGACDMGMLPDRLPGYRSVSDDAERGEMEVLWGKPLPSAAGKDARTLLTPGETHGVKALWLCRYDPVSTAFCGDAAEALDQYEFIVAQHLFLTDTAQHADVVLPTTVFGEERVTFTSTERRIQIADRVVEPVPGPIPAWQQVTRVAQRMGAKWPYETSADVMNEIASVVPLYSGVSYENLAAEYGRQWPCTKETPLGTGFLFAEANGRRFSFAPLRAPGPEPDGNGGYPFALVFSHSQYYWHRNVLMKHSETLKREYGILLLDYPGGFAEINPDDARELAIRDGQPIRLRSSTGEATVAARVTPEIRAGTVFVPFFVADVQRQVRGCAGNGVRSVPVRIEKEAA